MHNARDTPFGGGFVMIWSGIYFHALTELHAFDTGSLTGHRYITNILESYVIPFGLYIGEDFVQIQNKVKPYVTRCVGDYLNMVRIRTLDWLA